MSHYEKRLERDLKAINQMISEASRLIQGALDQALVAVFNRDRMLASEIVLGDHDINRRIRAIDAKCHAFVALYLPSAGHLRVVSSVLRMTVGLERVGDYVVTLAREAAQLSEPVPADVRRDIELIAEQCKTLLTQSVTSFVERDAPLAEATRLLGKQSKVIYDKLFRDLLELGERRDRPVKDLFALMMVFSRLNRIADQAENICEHTVYAVTGKGKDPRTHRVLFVDETNSFLSILAEAYARKAFPNSGRYKSAGWHPAERIDPRFVAFLDEKGIDLDGAKPSLVDPSLSALSAFHVLISVGASASPHLPEVPYYASLLHWAIKPSTLPEDDAQARAIMEQALIEVRSHVQELMITLRGEGAD